MATVNGTLKYKQDDGSIVELNPVGVDSTARTMANNNANAIGTWMLNNPISSIAGVIGEWDMTHDSGENITNVLAGITSDLSNEVTARKNADTALDTRVAKLEEAADGSVSLPIVGTVRSTMLAASGRYQVILALFPTVEYEKAVIKGINGIVDTGFHKADTVKIVRPTGEMTDVFDITPNFNYSYPEVTVILDSLPPDIVNGAVVSISGAYLYIYFQ